jgi:selenocysteine lyase/cysteine desulfurase
MPDFLPDRLEAGTQNMPGAAGLLAGLRYLMTRGVQSVQTQEQELAQLLVRQLGRIPGIEVFSGEQQTGVVSFRAEAWDSVVLGERLAQAGFALRSGLHCAPLAHETAGTLETGTIRVSLGPFNHRADVQALMRTLQDLLESENS